MPRPFPRRSPRRLFLPLLGVAGLVVIAVGIEVAAYYRIWVPAGQPHKPTPHRPSVATSVTPSGPACPTSGLPDAARLGTVAWVRSGELVVVDLRTCRQEVVVGTGAKPPVRFSPDGRWLAFGAGRVVPAAGGAVRWAFGSAVQSWQWSPVGDQLAAVTGQGGVLVATPGGQPRTLLPDGSGVGHLAFSPDGRRLAVDRAGQGIQVVELTTGAASTVFHQPDRARVPELAGWSPNGAWVLFWPAPIDATGTPLDAVPAKGGSWANVFDPMVPASDFISPCGGRLAITVGRGRAVSVGKQIVLTSPPTWSFTNLTNDYTRSWIWGSCSPDGRWLAATDSPNQREQADRTVPRGLWLLAMNGSTRRLVFPGTAGAPEFPRWSSDGRYVLVVVRGGDTWASPGSLFLVEIDPTSGRLVKRVGPIAEVGSAPGPGGNQAWASVTDWYRPRA